MTLQQKLSRIGAALAGAVPNTYHYWRTSIAAPFCVWAEDSEGASFHVDGGKREQVISGYVDYYTKTEYDTTLDTIQTVLSELEHDLLFTWRLDSVQFEEDTSLIHYQWTWEVA